MTAEPESLLARLRRLDAEATRAPWSAEDEGGELEAAELGLLRRESLQEHTT
jgi:hypothetical protein